MKMLRERIKRFAPVRKLLLNRLARKQGYSPLDINHGKIFEGETGKYDSLKFIDTIRKVEHIGPLYGRRGICIFAHYDRDGQFDPWVIEYLQKIAIQGFDIILVSSSPGLPNSVAEDLKGIVAKVLLRDNIGLDFGSWCCALSFIGPSIKRYKELLLCNDSVLGPFSDLDNVFRKFRRLNSDIFGLTESWEVTQHLQSYFLLFKKNVFHAKAFREFWNQIRVYENKLNIIHKYEIGLSSYFKCQGYRLDAFVGYDELRRVALSQNLLQEDLAQALVNYPQNPTLVLWDVLIEFFGFPFIKGELLRKNPHNHRRAVVWKTLVGFDSSMVSLIEAYLQRMKLPDARLDNT